MTKNRLEAFSDAVIAIILTIMVLELRPPEFGEEITSPVVLAPVVLSFVSYVLSYVYLGIYWNNHHHLFQAVKHVDGRVLWANLHLLFWLSLVPFATSWLGQSGFGSGAVAAYGIVLMFAAFAYYILTRTLLARHGPDSPLAHAVGRDFKGQVSIWIYLAAILLAGTAPWASCALYTLVAIIWLVPDRRIERTLGRTDG